MKILIKETAEVVEAQLISEKGDYNPLGEVYVVRYRDKDGRKYETEDVINVSVNEFWGQFRCNTAQQILAGSPSNSVNEAVELADKLIVELNK